LAFYTDFSGGRLDDKGNFAIEPGMLGFINSCYQLGSIFAVPIAPWFAHRFGRRWSIMLGSWIMVVGALIQGFSQHGMFIFLSRALFCRSAYRHKNHSQHDFLVSAHHANIFTFLQSPCTSLPACSSVSAFSSPSFLVPL